MTEPQTPTIDALHVFLAIADTGSFAAASRRLGRATSVVSYQLANLETQLGLTLLDRRGAKKIALTEAGQALVPNARAVAREVDSLLARARSLLGGVEAEVSLAVDVMMPMRDLTSILEDFRAAFGDLPDVLRAMVGKLRASMAEHLAEPAWKALVQRLQDASPEFCELWERRDVADLAGRAKVIRNARVGVLHLEHTNLWLGPAAGPRLGTYVPLDEESRARLERLLELAVHEETQAARALTAV